MSCGSEHSLALDSSHNVYSWGQGESGLLGHGNCSTLKEPKVIQSLSNLNVEHIVCGGLHSVCLTKLGWLYTWYIIKPRGKGEGGQLGQPFNFLSCENNEIFLTSPKRVKGLIENQIIKQVACGGSF